jgi:actin-related protein
MNRQIIETYHINDIQSRNNLLVEPNSKKMLQSFVQNIKKVHLPLIVDYGSGLTKAGWGNSENP